MTNKDQTKGAASNWLLVARPSDANGSGLDDT